MQEELNILEHKLLQLVQQVQALRKENTDLRQELAYAMAENEHLTEQMNAGRAKLGNLLTQLADEVLGQPLAVAPVVTAGSPVEPQDDFAEADGAAA